MPKPLALVARLGCLALPVVAAMAGPSRAEAQTSKAGKSTVFVGTYTDGKSQGSTGSSLTRRRRAIGAPAGHRGQESVVPRHCPRGRRLYAVSEVDSVDGKRGGAVAGFAVDPKSGELTALNVKSTVAADRVTWLSTRRGKTSSRRLRRRQRRRASDRGRRPARRPHGVRPAHRLQRQRFAPEKSRTPTPSISTRRTDSRSSPTSARQGPGLSL